MNVHINSFTGIDDCRHPASANRIGVAVLLDIQEGIIQPVHHNVVVVTQVDPSRYDKVRKLDIGHRINTDNLIFCRHRIHHYAVDTTAEWLIHTGAPVKVHI